jgi:hypothetical protein
VVIDLSETDFVESGREILYFLIGGPPFWTLLLGCRKQASKVLVLAEGIIIHRFFFFFFLFFFLFFDCCKLARSILFSFCLFWFLVFRVWKF